MHAALLHTGKVLFVTADETTLLWDPEDTTASTFEDPVNQPQQTPGPASGYSVLCGGHSFLSDGRLLVGDQRLQGSHEALVVCGHGAGDMEIYDEATDSFREVTAGDDKPFPSLYPGLHLLPNHSIFYSRTGWGTAGPGGGPFVGDDQCAYFSLTGPDTGMWTDIAPVGASRPDRTKGMSVMLLSSTPPYVRTLVLGGADPTTNDTYELVDATALSPATDWGTPLPFPDGEHRSLASAVLLPDGNVFVAGGIQKASSPCAMFNPQTSSGSWSAMAALPSIRDYHSVALLLPSGKVMMAGWNNTAIGVFSPPYLFKGPRPVISSAPASVQRGQSFTIESPHGPSIAKVVLMRPMAVTHEPTPSRRSWSCRAASARATATGTPSRCG